MAVDSETDKEVGLIETGADKLDLELRDKWWPRMKLAVIDVGYNSLKIVKYRVEPDGSVKAYGQLGVMARLGEGLERTGYLGKEPISRTIAALNILREAAAIDSIKHILLIGTSPVREAANHAEFIRQVRDETGLDMKVLTGNEEALYALLGAARSVDAPTALFFDLGGGSLELSYMENHRVKRILSLPLGALKLTSNYANRSGSFSRKDKAKMGEYISRLLPSKRELRIRGDATLVGMGGTVRAIARYEQDVMNYPLNKVHNYSVDYSAIQRMSREFFQLDMSELAQLEAIGENRSQTIAAGTFVVKSLMKKFGFKRLVVSTHGLRDGVLADFLGRRANDPGVLTEKNEVERLMIIPAAFSSPNRSLELLECLVRNRVFDKRQKKILMMTMGMSQARELAEVDPGGLFGVMMSEDLPMSHEDQLLMSLSLVRDRKPRIANWLVRRYGFLLSSKDAKSVRQMGACLRLMEILERSSANVSVAYSKGFRISISDSEEAFPINLARMAAEALSTSIKNPVSVTKAPKLREHAAAAVEAGR